ncbi:MAG: HTTM domain-containing protein [Ilumatobacteraceae bacterium]
MVERFDALLAERVSVRSLAVVRILVGAVATVHLWPLLRSALAGDTDVDRFRHPYASWLPELSPTPFTVLLAVGFVASIAMSVGLATRTSSITTFGVVAYHLALSTTHMHNNRAYLVSVLAILAMAPSGRAVSLDARRAERAGTPLDPTMAAWPLWLLRFQCAVVYAASGFSKLIDPDWFGGAVTWGRVAAQEAMVRSSVLPSFLAGLVLDRNVHTFAAKFIVLTELFVACGLWWRVTRRCAVAAAVVFHVMIGLTADVQVFSYLGLAVLFVWAPPTMWDRRWPMFQNRGMRESDIEGSMT